MWPQDDVRCTAAVNDDFDRASKLDAERAWRFVLALLSAEDDDLHAAEEVVAQLSDCPHCLRAFAWYLGGLVSTIMRGAGQREGAGNRPVQALRSANVAGPDVGANGTSHAA